MSTSIGNLLKYYRESMSLTQAQIASFLNEYVLSEEDKKFNQSSINKIEKGHKVPIDILAYLQNFFFLFNIKDSLDIFETAKEISDLFDYNKPVDIEQLLKLKTKEDIIKLLHEHCDTKNRNTDFFYIEKNRSLENMLEYYPNDVFVALYYKSNNIESLEDSITKTKVELNSLAIFVLFITFIYLIKCSNNMLINKNSDIEDYIYSLDEIIEFMEDEEFQRYFTYMTNAKNWNESNDAAKGKYLVSLNKKICISKSFEDLFPMYFNFYSEHFCDLVDEDSSISTENKTIIKKEFVYNKQIKDGNIDNIDVKEVTKALSRYNLILNNPFKSICSVYYYYQHIYLPNESDINILIKKFEDENWLNNIPFIDSKALKRTLMDITSINDFEERIGAYKKMSELYENWSPFNND